MPGNLDQVLQRELDYHERLYSGFAQQHFAKPAVRALRSHIVSRVLKATGAGPKSKVLSLGCGIGDTELLLAPHVGELVGIDLSPAAILQAQRDTAAAGIGNVRFQTGSLELVQGRFDVIIAIFLLHHLPDAVLETLPAQIREHLEPKGAFYALDPSRLRLAGFVGSLVCPRLMASYQTPDERELDAEAVAQPFRKTGFACQIRHYDFISTPLAGLFPAWKAGYQSARVLDELLIRVPGLNKLSSNFELLASMR